MPSSNRVTRSKNLNQHPGLVDKGKTRRTKDQMDALRAEEKEKKEQKKKEKDEKVGRIAAFEQSLMDDNEATPRPSSKRTWNKTIRQTSSLSKIALLDSQSEDEAQNGVVKKVKLTDVATENLEESDNFEPGVTGTESETGSNLTMEDPSEAEPEAHL